MKSDLVSVNEKSSPDVQMYPDELRTFQSLLDSSLDVICSIDKDGRFLHVSAAAKNVWGYEPEELVANKYMDFVVDEDHAKTLSVATMIMSGIDVTSFENRYRKKDGTVVPILWSARWSEAEQIMYCVAKDASHIEQAQERKKLLERRLSRAYKLANIAWWEYDVASQTYTSSDEIFHMYGLPVPASQQYTLEQFLSCVHPDDKDKLLHDLSHISQETYLNYEHRVVKPSGEVIYVIHYLEIIRDGNGNPVSIHGTTKDITKMKLQQLRLEESEKRLQQYARQLTNILESIGDGFFTVDREGVVTYWNRKAEELLGRQRSDIVGKKLWDEYSDVLHLKFYSEYLRAVNGNIAVQFEEYFPPRQLWLEVAAYPSEEGLSVYFKDITEKKQQQQALQLANERFELAAKATSDALWDWDVLTNTCYFSEAFTTQFGYENTADLVYKNWMDNIHEADIKETLEALAGALDDVSVSQWQCEYRFYKRDRTIANVLDRGFIIRDPDGKAVRVVGSMQDITKIKETEVELKKLSFVAKETPNAVVITDGEENITWVNKAFTDITGYTFEEAVGKKPGKLLQGPNTSARTKNYLRKCIRERKPFNCEIINYSKSGREYWMEIKGQPFFGDSGELTQFFAIQTDITARKEAEALIRLSEEKYKLLFYSSPRPKWIFHAETLQVVDVNNAAIALYGYSRNEFLNLHLKDLRLPEDEPELFSAAQSYKKSKENSFQQIVRHRKKTGETFYINIYCFPLRLPTGPHFIVTGIDMTEKLQLQQQLIAEKINAQKKIARAIIHAQETERSEVGKELHDNVCQLLTTAKLYLENLKHFPDKQEEFATKGVELLKKSIGEIRCLSRQLVTPASTQMDFEAGINELIDHYLSMNVFQIHFDYQTKMENLDNDLKTAVMRILQEQFNNTVKYANATAVHLCVSNKENCLHIKYEDDGIGFDPTKMKKGLGLTNIENRAGAYRGTLSLKTAEGKGYCMEISFPLSDEPDYGNISQQMN